VNYLTYTTIHALFEGHYYKATLARSYYVDIRDDVRLFGLICHNLPIYFDSIVKSRFHSWNQLILTNQVSISSGL